MEALSTHPIHVHSHRSSDITLSPFPNPRGCMAVQSPTHLLVTIEVTFILPQTLMSDHTQYPMSIRNQMDVHPWWKRMASMEKEKRSVRGNYRFQVGKLNKRRRLDDRLLRNLPSQTLDLRILSQPLLYWSEKRNRSASFENHRCVADSIRKPAVTAEGQSSSVYSMMARVNV